jgi:3-oxoadipate enol-lactonase
MIYKDKLSSLEYELSGKKSLPVLCFLHGAGANMSQFYGQRDYFSKDFQILLVNLPGHGESNLNDDISLENMAAALLNLMKHLSLSSCHIVGNSMGGNVGYAMLQAAPDSINSLTTFGTTPRMQSSKITLASLKAVYRVFSLKLIASLASQSGISKEAKNHIRAMFLSVEKSILLSLLPMLASFDFIETIKKEGKRVPITVMRSEKDGEINKLLDPIIEEFGSLIKKLSLPGCGHFANLDDAELFNRSLAEVLD